MEFLIDLGFMQEDIDMISSYAPDKVADIIKENSMAVAENISYLKNLGVTNYKEAFARYAGMFLIDASIFQGIFSKYDKEDMIDKIIKNVGILEHL